MVVMVHGKTTMKGAYVQADLRAKFMGMQIIRDVQSKYKVGRSLSLARVYFDGTAGIARFFKNIMSTELVEIVLVQYRPYNVTASHQEG